MKLYHQPFPSGWENFGDYLNPWIWERLLPEYLDADARAVFVGFGTLLNDHLPAQTPEALDRVIFSTGVGYYQGVPAINEDYRFYCVRGPLSAKALGLHERAVCTDGAALVARLYTPEPTKRYPFSFMPHIERMADEAWASVCAELGFGFIDPRWPVERTLAAISETEVLIAEAMHGAIVADALRVPWIPVTTSPNILAFKWEDWCQSLNLTYQPARLAAPVNLRRTADLLMPVRMARYHFLRLRALHQLNHLARTARSYLSRERDLERRIVQLEERLEQFKREYSPWHRHPKLELSSPLTTRSASSRQRWTASSPKRSVIGN